MPEQPSDLEALLDLLRRTRGFDLTGYKRASLERRISKRVAETGCGTLASYVRYLATHPEEFEPLFDAVLINVTCFFRDESNWDFLAKSVVPDIIARRQPGSPIRVWSAGCASGEEAYTLAMVFAEAFGIEAFQNEVKIYATDFDEATLAKGRRGTYSEHEVVSVPAPLLERYFDGADGSYRIRAELRRHVIFGRHDLLHDAPIPHVDLLVCRNTLMYLNAEAQARILARFEFALRDHGILFLGRAETLMARASGFASVDLERRISRKLPTSRASVGDGLARPAGHDNGSPATSPPSARLRDAALETDPTAQLLVDLDGTLVVANRRARALLTISTGDVGRRLGDLEILHHSAALRWAIEQAHGGGRPVVLRDVEWPSAAGEIRRLDIRVSPLYDAGTGSIIGVSVAFKDTTAARRLRRELEQLTAFLERILLSVRGAVVVVDADLEVLVWNQGAEDLWGVREDDVRGTSILRSDTGLPVDRLEPLLRGCLSGTGSDASMMLDALDRRGRAVSCRVTASPLMARRQSVRGVILFVEVADVAIASEPRPTGDSTSATQ